MPMELGRELVTIVGPDFANVERELVDSMNDDVDRVGLCLFPLDFQGANEDRVINRRVLGTMYLLALLSNKCQNLTPIWI